jgi:hypothetical protein
MHTTTCFHFSCLGFKFVWSPQRVSCQINPFVIFWTGFLKHYFEQTLYFFQNQKASSIFKDYFGKMGYLQNWISHNVLNRAIRPIMRVNRFQKNKDCLFVFCMAYLGVWSFFLSQYLVFFPSKVVPFLLWGIYYFLIITHLIFGWPFDLGQFLFY